jgi:hypothetical protein
MLSHSGATVASASEGKNLNCYQAIFFFCAVASVHLNFLSFFLFLSHFLVSIFQTMNILAFILVNQYFLFWGKRLPFHHTASLAYFTSLLLGALTFMN